MMYWLCQWLNFSESPEQRYVVSDDVDDGHHLHMIDMMTTEIELYVEELTLLEEENTRKERRHLPDYSWLVTRKHQGLTVTQKHDIEQLCRKVKPEEWNNVVLHFRSRAGKCQKAREVIPIFEDVVENTIQSRPRYKSLSGFLRAYLNSRSSPKLGSISQSPAAEYNKNPGNFDSLTMYNIV